MTIVDFYASSPHYADHLAPIRAAMPVDRRGDMHTILPRGPAAPTVCSAVRDTRVAIRYQRPVAVTEHGYGQSYSSESSSYPGGKGLNEVSLFLAPNDHAAARWRESYPKARVETVGCPKLDALPSRVPGPGPVICASFHWDCWVAPESRNAWDYYKRILPELAKRFTLIGHAHPRIMARLRPIYERLGIPVVESFEDVCRQADVYVVDNSSTLYEFASTDRPVVVMNAPWYRRNVSHGLRFWDAATVGMQCDRPSDLGDVIEAALADPPEQKAARNAALDLVYSVRHGAAQRAADVLVDWADGVVQ